jgi:hypothetical protein
LTQVILVSLAAADVPAPAIIAATLIIVIVIAERCDAVMDFPLSLAP